MRKRVKMRWIATRSRLVKYYKYNSLPTNSSNNNCCRVRKICSGWGNLLGRKCLLWKGVSLTINAVTEQAQFSFKGPFSKAPLPACRIEWRANDVISTTSYQSFVLNCQTLSSLSTESYYICRHEPCDRLGVTGLPINPRIKWRSPVCDQAPGFILGAAHPRQCLTLVANVRLETFRFVNTITRSFFPAGSIVWPCPL